MSIVDFEQVNEIWLWSIEKNMQSDGVVLTHNWLGTGIERQKVKR